MAGGGSRGIHAARPTARHLRLACTQVAICGGWAGVEEKQDQKPKQNQEQKQANAPRKLKHEAR
jgi:hypothetical protein